MRTQSHTSVHISLHALNSLRPTVSMLQNVKSRELRLYPKHIVHNVRAPTVPHVPSVTSRAVPSRV